MNATTFGSQEGQPGINEQIVALRRRRRYWLPNLALMADQLVADYQHGGDYPGPPVLATFDSWMAIAEAQGAPFTDTNWIDLARELARRAAGV